MTAQQPTAMPVRAFQFGHFHHLFAPRKPRHPLMRVAVGLVGLAILAVLIFFSVFVGSALIFAGVVWKLVSKQDKRKPRQARVIDAEYRVVRKPVLPLSQWK